MYYFGSKFYINRLRHVCFMDIDQQALSRACMLGIPFFVCHPVSSISSESDFQNQTFIIPPTFRHF